MTRIFNNLENGISIEDYYHLLTEYNCAVVETSLTCHCDAFTLKNECEYVIYINTDKTKARQIKALKHELKHIINKDFNNEVPIFLKED